VRVSTPFGYSKRATVWVRRRDGRILLLAAGDSEMQILDGIIANDLRPHGVDVTPTRGSARSHQLLLLQLGGSCAGTGTVAATDATVIFLGANDGFPVAGPRGRQVSCCGAAWSSGYARLVGETMQQLPARQQRSRLLVPVAAPRPANFHTLFDAINLGIRRAAARFPGSGRADRANAFFTPGDRYAISCSRADGGS